MSSSQYTSEYPPATSFDPEYKSFFESFYKLSDTPDVHDLYAAQFTSDATFIMASKKVQGTDGILALRKGIWETTATRRHFPEKVFPFGAESDEVIIYGTVEYVRKNGDREDKDWAARGKLVKEGGAVKLSFYQVYLDPSPAAK